jgi:hypothetical protein
MLFKYSKCSIFSEFLPGVTSRWLIGVSDQRPRSEVAIRCVNPLLSLCLLVISDEKQEAEVYLSLVDIISPRLRRIFWVLYP